VYLINYIQLTVVARNLKIKLITISTIRFKQISFTSLNLKMEMRVTFYYSIFISGNQIDFVWVEYSPLNN